MDKFFNQAENVESFNKLKEVYTRLNYKDIENTPCCIFVELYERLETGSLNDVPKYFTSSLEFVSNLEYLKQNNDDAYIIQGICILPEMKEAPEFTRLQDFKEYSFKNGLYLDITDWLGQHIKNKFDNYSPSWFDDYDSA